MGREARAPATIVVSSVYQIPTSSFAPRLPSIMADIDYEKAHEPKVDAATSHSANSNDADVIDGMYSERPSLATRMGITPESFKKRTLADKHNQLNKTLKSRHLHMIAIGGSIGAGLFVGSGSALSTGGPASLLICFMIIGVVSHRDVDYRSILVANVHLR